MAESDGFDVVVVGAGAAGCVLAARTAAASSASVLLLEAGPDLRADLPTALRDGWRIEREPDWGYEAEPNPQGRVQRVWRNKLVGGTSWQTRFAPRGAPADYDEWAALGNTGWGFDDVLPYFKRLESDGDYGDTGWHGDAGPMPVTRYLDLEYTDIAAAAYDALGRLGFPHVDDHNQPGAVGYGRMPMTTRDGVRVTSADAYLPAGRDPQNLTVRGGAAVAGVVFDGTRAAGVRLLDGSVVEAGEVVLCAGVYGNPPILMRSGIGAADHVRSHGIDVRVDLPGVGANLADHPCLALDSGYRGPMRSEPILHFIATWHSSQRAADAAPDLMFWCSDPEEDDLFEIGVVLLRPRSRGRVELRSADAADAPRVWLPALDDDYDVERLIEGYERGLELANDSGVRAQCSDPVTPVASDDGVEAMIRREAFSLPHVVGTCAMGTHAAEGAVVDALGRVHGTEGLRVVDASIMPDVPSGFTHIPTIMIAERLAAEILAS